ncbi:MAG: hypothetical protein JNM40_03835 [Myxococcales bacterium]|nr:hypothetical protein [Myxococcales bacterium]
MRLIVATLLLCVLLSVRLASAEPASWRYVVKLDSLARASIQLSLRGVRSQRVCVDMSGAGRFVHRVEQLLAGGKAVALPVHDECWTLKDTGSLSATLRYEYDLASAADAFGNADYVQRLGSAVTFSDEAVLLRPDPLPKETPSPTIEVEFALASGLHLTAPWLRLPGPALRFRLDAAQYDGGSYITVGNFRSLGSIALPHASVELFLIGQAKASDQALRTWIEQAARLSDDFYGELMPASVHIVLFAMSGHSRPGVFGTVMRPMRPSLVIFFGADAAQLSLHDDWLAPHEIFHIGNPLLKYKIPWLAEGATTYYQDVLRGRSRALSVEETWSDLWDGFYRHCQTDGPSLRTESEQLRRTHRYSRVYWGGACMLALVDIEIRIRSKGKRSLDDVLRELRKKSLVQPLDEDDVISALEHATTKGLLTRYLDMPGKLPVREVLRSIGVEPISPDRVQLRDDAPFASIRRAMF